MAACGALRSGSCAWQNAGRRGAGHVHGSMQGVAERVMCMAACGALRSGSCAWLRAGRCGAGH
eukprot:178871-Chlamydomonas_euryale.AAC.1